MKVLAALLGGALTLAIASGKCAAADSIEGVWRTFSEATGAERAWVRVERTGDVYEGSLVRLFRQTPSRCAALVGQEYRCQVRLVNSGRTLEVRGYVGFSVFGRTQSWARVGP